MKVMNSKWNFRLRKRVKVTSGQLGGIPYRFFATVTHRGGSLTGTAGPLTLTLGRTGLTITTRAGPGISLSRHFRLWPTISQIASRYIRRKDATTKED